MYDLSIKWKNGNDEMVEATLSWYEKLSYDLNENTFFSELTHRNSCSSSFRWFPRKKFLQLNFNALFRVFTWSIYITCYPQDVNWTYMRIKFYYALVLHKFLFWIYYLYEFCIHNKKTSMV